MPQANPFEVLRLDPQTPGEEVVRHAGLLRQRAAGEQEIAVIRQAAQALTGRPEERTLHELLTHAEPCYRWPALEALAAAWRRAPVLAEGHSNCPRLELKEAAELFRAAAAEEWDTGPQPLEMPDLSEPAEEIARQIAEAWWQCLPCDPGA